MLPITKAIIYVRLNVPLILKISDKTCPTYSTKVLFILKTKKFIKIKILTKFTLKAICILWALIAYVLKK